jgi:hypothetical protein
MKLISVVFLLFQPNGLLNESFSVFCPVEKLDCMELLRNEDVLIDWATPLFLNFTHKDIVERIESFYDGTIDKTEGDIYVCSEMPEEIQIDEYDPSKINSFFKYSYFIGKHPWLEATLKNCFQH